MIEIAEYRKLNGEYKEINSKYEQEETVSLGLGLHSNKPDILESEVLNLGNS